MAKSLDKGGQLRRNRREGRALTLVPSIGFFDVIRKSEDLRPVPRDWHN